MTPLDHTTEPPVMTTDFSGTWRSGRSEGWPELLDKLDIPREKLPKDLKVTQLIAQSGNTVNVKTTNNFDDGMRETTIVVGEAFTDPAGGFDFQYATAWDERGRLVLTRTSGAAGGVTRELTPDGDMLTVHDHDGVVAKSYFTRVK